MANLFVENQTLRFKGAVYQISQINMLELAEIKVKNNPVKPKIPIRNKIIITIVFGLITFTFFYFGNNWGVISLLLFVVSLFFLGRTSARTMKWFFGPKIRKIYGLHMRMANGGNPVFMSSDKDLLLKVKKGILKSMNNKYGNTVTFDNVKIDISSAENVEIGNIIGDGVG